MIAKRIGGILLIIAGIVFCCGLIVFQHQHCVDMWSNTYKVHEYSSAMDYFFAVSKGAVIISILGGGILVACGAMLCKNERYC